MNNLFYKYTLSGNPKSIIYKNINSASIYKNDLIVSYRITCRNILNNNIIDYTIAYYYRKHSPREIYNKRVPNILKHNHEISNSIIKDSFKLIEKL